MFESSDNFRLYRGTSKFVHVAWTNVEKTIGICNQNFGY